MSSGVAAELIPETIKVAPIIPFEIALLILFLPSFQYITH